MAYGNEKFVVVGLAVRFWFRGTETGLPLRPGTTKPSGRGLWRRHLRRRPRRWNDLTSGRAPQINSSLTALAPLATFAYTITALYGLFHLSDQPPADLNFNSRAAILLARGDGSTKQVTLSATNRMARTPGLDDHHQSGRQRETSAWVYTEVIGDPHKSRQTIPSDDMPNSAHEQS